MYNIRPSIVYESEVWEGNRLIGVRHACAGSLKSIILDEVTISRSVGVLRPAMRQLEVTWAN